MNNLSSLETGTHIINEDFNLFKTLSEGNNNDDPYFFYKKLRESEPVFYMKSSAGFLSDNMWIISKYADINKVLSSRKFGRGTHLAGNPDYPSAKERKINTLAVLKQNWVTFIDPPLHTKIREFINKTFTTKLVYNFEPRISAISNYLIDCFEDEGEFEMKNDFSYPMAGLVIAELLGIPPEERNYIRGWGNKLLKVLDGVAKGFSADEIQSIYKAADEIKDYFQNIVAEKKANPKEDLISALLNMEIDGEKLSELEVAANAALLVVDAHESTKNLIANGMYALLQEPEQFEMLKKDPSLTENAIEEFLRYDSPGQFTGRIAHEDYELGGKLIKKGSQVICMLGSGNRDPEEFENPDKLDILRKNVKPLSFGGGIHYCAGAMLSRLEGQVAFDTLLKRLPDMRLKEDEEYHYEKTFHGRGLVSLDLKF